MSARERAREAKERFEELARQSDETIRMIADLRWSLESVEAAIAEYLENRANDEALEISAAAFPEITPAVGNGVDSFHLSNKQTPGPATDKILEIGEQLAADMKRQMD